MFQPSPEIFTGLDQTTRFSTGFNQTKPCLVRMNPRQSSQYAYCAKPTQRLLCDEHIKQTVDLSKIAVVFNPFTQTNCAVGRFNTNGQIVALNQREQEYVKSMGMEVIVSPQPTSQTRTIMSDRAQKWVKYSFGTSDVLCYFSLDDDRMPMLIDLFLKSMGCDLVSSGHTYIPCSRRDYPEQSKYMIPSMRDYSEQTDYDDHLMNYIYQRLDEACWRHYLHTFQDPSRMSNAPTTLPRKKYVSYTYQSPQKSVPTNYNLYPSVSNFPPVKSQNELYNKLFGNYHLVNDTRSESTLSDMFTQLNNKHNPQTESTKPTRTLNDMFTQLNNKPNPQTIYDDMPGLEETRNDNSESMNMVEYLLKMQADAVASNKSTTIPSKKEAENWNFSPSIPTPSADHIDTYTEESEESSSEEEDSSSSFSEDIILAERKDLPDSNSGSMIDFLIAKNKDSPPKMKDEVQRPLEQSTPVKFCGKHI